MNKKIKYITGTAILLASLLMLSCKGMFSQKIEEPSSKDGKTYLTLKVNNSRQAYRTLASDKNLTFDITQFTDFSLIGKHESEEAKSLFEAASYSVLPQKIEIMSGQWEFNLYAKYKGIQFSDAGKSQYIMKGRENSISFTLKPVEEFGGCDISFTLTDSQVSKVEVTLKSSSDEKIILDKSPLQISENNGAKTVSFKRNMASESERLSSGRYYAKFDFYTGQEGPKGYALLNEYESYLIITAAFTTSANITLDFNELYTITYKYITDSGEAVELVDAESFALASNSFVPFYYSKGSEITLPEAKQNKKIFLGWKNSDGQPIEKIEKGSSGNLVLTAEFMDPVLYVSGTGDDPTGDGSEENPFESIDKACEKIIEVGTADAEWTIYIVGDVTGPYRDNLNTGESPRKAGDRRYTRDFGRSIIPAELTLEHAKSILITGYHQPSDPSDYPQDMINRGLLEVSSTSYGVGPALSIDTEVPVTITNVKLTNARNDMSNGNTNNESLYNQGGGLGIGANSTVYLGNNVYIEHNKAKYGGGIYNAGTLYIYGSACIGDKTLTKVANGYVYNKDDDNDFKSSNEYSQGGGVYNIGKLYLGYTRYISESDNEPLEWTGGMYRSYGYTSSGGGIYITGNSTAVMNSGTIAYNDGQATGGGVTINSGTFIMTGGTICHNSTGGGGGGVKVEPEGIFYFGGGTISANWATANGGGIFIDGSSSPKGKVFMYGEAVVGDKNKTTAPFAIISANQSDGQNATNGGGGGIYTSGYLYMGYSSYSDETDYTISPLTGGICYNYSSTTGNNSGGGGIYISSESNGSDTDARVRMNSGTIANNTASKGGALYLSGKRGIVLSGTASIASDLAHDIYTLSYPIYIKDTLEKFSSSKPVYITSSCDDKKTKYYNNEPVLSLASNATISSLSDVKEKFAMIPLIATETGIVTNWDIGNDGKVVQRIGNLYVSSSEKGGSDTNDGLSASTPLATLSAAIAKMNNETTDYTITLNGELVGPQKIETPEGKSKILANSIKIIGKNTSNNSSYAPTDILNGNNAGSALTINTTVPVTLNGVMVKNGKGTTRDSKIIGGGILLEEEAYVSLENNSRIIENTTYDGTSTSGYGAGIYVSKNAKLYLNSSSIVADNIGTSYGAGIYVAEDGFVKLIKGSGCYIKNNTFDERFKQSGQSVAVKGGGIYLENGATLEMQGGYVQDNTANTTGSSIGRGSGIYVSESAVFKISGSATVSLPNDVYLKGNVPVQVPDGLTLSLRARLTPGTYPSATATEDTVLVIKAAGVSATLSGCFEITPQTISGDEKQYWALDNDGKMVKKVGMGLTVSIPSGNDIEVSISDGNDDPIEGGTHLTGGSTLVFTITDQTIFSNCKWKVDGEEQTTSNEYSLSVNTSNWAPGTYVVYLEAQDKDGKYYSYTAQIKVGN